MVLEGTEKTAQQIAAALDDVPASSVYRHLQLLQEAGIVEVVAERPVRGAVEKTLRLVANAGSLDQNEAAQMTVDDFRRSLLAFHTQLFHEFEQYVQREGSDPGRDLIGFNAVTLYATDEEMLTVIAAMNAAIEPLLKHKPGAGRIRRRLASWMLPLTNVEEEES